jgi:tetratricopeptide (TPR) repeat protein
MAHKEGKPMEKPVSSQPTSEVSKTSEVSALLHGKRVAFTGKLACMTRPEAARMVRATGGEFVADVNRRTSLVVVGLEGWPLQKNGRLTRKLIQARRLQHYGYPITVLPEEELLSQVGLRDQSEGIHERYTMAHLHRILHIPGERLRAWMNAGLIQPAETSNGVCRFDFQQVTRAKTLCDLAQAGISAQRLRRSLEQLKKWMPQLGDPLAQLAVIERQGDILVRLEDGQLAGTTGQLHFDFEEKVSSIAVEMTPPARTGDQWFNLARDHDLNGRVRQAAEAYRVALLLDGLHPDVCFNLANVFYAMNQKEQAVERYYQALELDPHFAPAWNNLGNALADLGKTKKAREAFQKAVAIDPHLASAAGNLAALENESRPA